MSVNVDTDFSDIYSSISGQNALRGRYDMGNQMISDMNRFVPRKSGDLRQHVMLTDNAEQIHYTQIYARRHFYAPGNWNYTTPGTGPRWDQKAQAMYSENWANIYARGARL